MSERIPVLVNRSGGTAAARGDALGPEIEKAFADAGLAIDLQLLPGDRVAEAAAKVADRELVVVGGGDGTLGGAAGALAHAGATLGILPLGTRNHLARELGVPLKLPEAAKLIATGTQRRIDLARVNDHVFVNNASIGFYPDLVHQREDMALPKKLAALPAAAAAVRRMRHRRLRLEMPDREESVVTPMLFVGNNRYVLEAGKLGQREALDDGVLSVYAVASRRRMALIGFALRALIGRADPDRDFAAIGDTPELRVTGPKRCIDVALDGEVKSLAVPLDFTLEARALSVIAPADGS
ncbi:diacylglycerol kinase family enzyme [Sphingomonas naasensis]|uniref:diacylglycerol/lipid kinase family protein n=1 Tax=Sphingomonas naasensis TaxID=1344951 RepID=UPI00141B7C40|nr:diacylglycerol kinase family protein [Sphingomonas naasensis]NIJ18570.1 diacylglycerol kinase family enzyme [Sphingomonas naasensis]